jgi:Proteasome subunit
MDVSLFKYETKKMMLSMKRALGFLMIFVTTAFAQGNRKSKADEGKLARLQPDPWVLASPLILSAVCSDGIALIAIHNDPSEESSKGRTDEIENGIRDTLRIFPLDQYGSALLCAGWRTDAAWLASKCRSISRDEVQTFGSPPLPHVLAQEASLWMAHCAVSDSVRELHTVGLLAAYSASSVGELYLIDSTGSYRVRAYALGKGSNYINKRLKSMDFTGVSAGDGIQRLLKLLVKESNKVDSDSEEWQALPPSTRVELAIVDFKSHRLQRIRQPFLVMPSKL